MTGTATTATGTTDEAIINSDVFTNLTDGDLLVTYTITPYVGTCAGSTFDVIITVKPEPVVAANIEATVCSDEVIGVDLPTTDDSGLGITTYDITAVVDANLTGTATTATGTTDEAIINSDVFTNLTDGALTVTYTCLLYTSPSPRDQRGSRMPSSA